MLTSVASPRWDLVVIGSGPAGASAAIGALSAVPDASVLMLDRSEFPRDKCCGDGVLSPAMNLLAEHGVATSELLRDFESADEMTLRSPRGMTLSRRLPERMTVIPRFVFDARLRDAALAAGADSLRHTARRLTTSPNGVRIDDLLDARVVIGADGAESVTRRAVFGPGHQDVAVAIRGYDRNQDDPTPRMVFDGKPGLSYAWRFPSSSGRANVGYGHLLRAGQATNRHQLLASMDRLLPGLDVEASSLRAARLSLSTSRQSVARGRVLLAGDAASLVNPISGEGIYYAISSGLAAGAAAVLDPSRAAQTYRRFAHRRFGRHHRHVRAMAAATRFPAVLEAGLRAARADQAAFEDLAGLGLAEGGITANLAWRLGVQLLTA